MGNESTQENTGAEGGTPTREELNDRAAELGIASPEKLKNIDAVKEAIADAEAADRFTREEVLEHARSLTGYSRNHMVGALHGNDTETFSREQAKAAAEDFAQRKVSA